MAEEGFRKGLRVIAIKNHLNPGDFFTAATDFIYQTGYIKVTFSKGFHLDSERIIKPKRRKGDADERANSTNEKGNS